MSSAPPALRIEGLTLSLRGLPVLEDVAFSVPHGEFVGLIGPNGGGKSMLLRAVLGLQPFDRGRVEVYGHAPAAARGLVTHVPQYVTFDRDFPVDVLEVVLMGRLGPSPWRRVAPDDEARARQALERVGLTDLAARQIGRLSGGQLQRVLVARALATDARLLLLDEPTSNLDARQVMALHELLAELAGEKTIILASHDIGVITRYVGSIACLNRRLVYHHGKEITREMIEDTYGCPVDFVVHSHRHVVLEEHDEGGRESGGAAPGGHHVHGEDGR